MRRRALLFIVGSLPSRRLLRAYQGERMYGTIRGIVLNELGQSVAGAKVRATLLDNRPKSKAVIYEETDKSGRFSIDRLEWGRYRVNGKKEADGYADTYFPFYGNGAPQEVTLSPQAALAIVSISLGPKAGTIFGSVSDALTGDPLHSAFHLWRLNDPGNWLDTSAPPNYRILIPANTGVGISVRAAGHAEWPLNPLRLQPGQELKLDIRLQASTR